MSEFNEYFYHKCQQTITGIENLQHSIRRLQFLIITLVESDLKLIEKLVKKEISEKEKTDLIKTHSTLNSMYSHREELNLKKSAALSTYFSQLVGIKESLAENLQEGSIKKLKKLTQSHHVSNLL